MLITLDGKIVKDIGECTGWTDENNSIVRFVQYDEKMKIAITILDTLIWMARLLWRTITMIPLL